MLAVTGKSVSELFAEIAEQYGDPQWAEADFRMTPARKAELQERLFVHCETPDFGKAVDHISREDGCKVYFTDGSWVICRFSGHGAAGCAWPPRPMSRRRRSAAFGCGARSWACKKY